MGIDIYATWKGQTSAEKQNQLQNIFGIDAGKFGYLREAYHGEPYATKVLLPELWNEDFSPDEGVKVAANELAGRLGETLSTAILRQHKVYEEDIGSDATVAVCQSFKDFVELCARKEAETGIPCCIIGSY